MVFFREHTGIFITFVSYCQNKGYEKDYMYIGRNGSDVR